MMSRIKILPEILSNKIAAGEVVERPASVVKELVENALDAESTKIIIEVEKGGRSLIRVSDNGIGMIRDDALLAIERYATSKIFNDRDLFAINTLGFRGEALPSVAAVSKFGLVTRAKSSQAGTEIIVEGGTIKKVSDIGAPSGTMISVKQLFFNTPARRKFLKTINTELGHIADAITSMAIGWPGVQFQLLHNSKLLKGWSATNVPDERVVDVLGQNLGKELKKIEFSDEHISITGWISSPRITRSTSRGIYVYVNGRFVRDRIIQHSLFAGYDGRLMKGQFPVAVLFINIPFDQVDVNVHPTKHEIRFLEQKIVHNAVGKAVAEALRLADESKWVPTFYPKEKPVAQQRVEEPVTRFNRKATGISGLKEQKDETAEQAALWEKKSFADLRVIGQFHNTYILCEYGDGLVLIDQHAAHERVLFEQLKNRNSDSRKTGQRLLVPETIDFAYREAEIFTDLMPDFHSLGLEVEPFGGNTFVIKSVPAMLADRDIKPLLMEIVEKMIQIGFSPGLENAIDQCLILVACHGAIRANQRLSDEQIKALMKQLDACDKPSNCPHGRPTWIRWSTKDLEKSFGRIG